MRTYSFTLVLGGVTNATPGLEDLLYAAHCDDALINFRNHTAYLDFDREASSLEAAIISAIKDVESSKLVFVSHVAPDDWVSEIDIAKRLDMSRQIVNLWISGERRSDIPFPHPAMRLAEKSPLWRWRDVALWLYQNKIVTDENIIADAILIENINAALDERQTDIQQSRHNLIKKLAA